MDDTPRVRGGQVCVAEAAGEAGRGERHGAREPSGTGGAAAAPATARRSLEQLELLSCLFPLVFSFSFVALSALQSSRNHFLPAARLFSSLCIQQHCTSIRCEINKVLLSVYSKFKSTISDSLSSHAFTNLSLKLKYLKLKQ